MWESEDAARQFFSDQLLERVTGLYGVRPQVEFAEIIELVDNAAVVRRSSGTRRDGQGSRPVNAMSLVRSSAASGTATFGP